MTDSVSNASFKPIATAMSVSGVSEMLSATNGRSEEIHGTPSAKYQTVGREQ
ncbi:hypothetical protein [Microcoleus sp. bin38.metabat.b11b12b14.051]|uniref:hypothetical protein n=1 Tax=Microcoleus sp. bin38.metabat.b11b12b14.051 TaxID=2742709 RepID=UPI0025D1C8B4|nr:hypothetical protein [Microcoleus sp. bin38.metabat.b11b12b14.051]